MNMQRSNEWAENYHENIGIIMSEFNFDDLTFDHVRNMSISSPKVSSNNKGSLIPKGTIGKPIRRRSRASKGAPTTLLNANASNFRALVQQFTGCHSSSPVPFGAYKGPINLNFAKYKNHCSGKLKAQQQNQHENQNPHEESDQSFFSFGNYTKINAAVTPTTSTIMSTLPYTDIDRELFVSTVNCNSRITDYPLTLDHFGMEDNFSLEELSGTEDYSAVAGARFDDLWGYLG